MLILTRKLGETLFVEHAGSTFEVQILGVFGRQVRLGITGPTNFSAHRFSECMQCCTARMVRIRTMQILPFAVHLAICCTCQKVYVVDERKRQRVEVGIPFSTILGLLGVDAHIGADEDALSKHLATLQPPKTLLENLVRTLQPWLDQLHALLKKPSQLNESM